MRHLRAVRLAGLVGSALVLSACGDAGEVREPPAPPPAAAPAPAQAADAGVPPAATGDSVSGLPEYFGFNTEEFESEALSPWREPDPAAYSGTYEGEFGDGGYRVIVQVRSAEGGFQVSGSIEETGLPPHRKPEPFGPVPLRLDGSARFDSPQGVATFLRFKRPQEGGPTIDGLLLAGPVLFCEKAEP